MICIGYKNPLLLGTVKQRLRELLSLRQKRHIVDARRVPSAVLVPVFYKHGQHCILFTRRTTTVKTHKGQISFPGGVYEDEDGTLVDTALRECAEEIGLMAQDVEVLGELDDEPSVTTNYIITPFVGIIPWPYQFKLNEEETEEIIEVPISTLLEGGGQFQEVETLEGKVFSYAYQYCGTTIWGATARILNKFLDIFARAMQDSQTDRT